MINFKKVERTELIIIFFLGILGGCGQLKETNSAKYVDQPFQEITDSVDVYGLYIKQQKVKAHSPSNSNGNLLSNGDFEDGLTGWTSCEADKTELTTSAYEGSGAVELSSNSCVYQTLEINPLDEITASCYVKVLSGDGWTGMGLVFSDENWNEVGRAPTALITLDDFAKYLTKKTAPAGSKFVSIWVHTRANVVVDKCSEFVNGELENSTVTLEQSLELQPQLTPDENLLQNPSFDGANGKRTARYWSRLCHDEWRSTGGPRTGIYSLLLRRNTCAAQSLSATDIAAVAGNEYIFNCYIHFRDSRQSATLEVYFDGVMVKSDTIRLNYGYLSYTAVRVSGLAPANISNGYVQIRGGATETLVEDCSFQVVPLNNDFIPDENLKNLLRESLNLGIDDIILKTDMLDLTVFPKWSASASCSQEKCKVHDLTGLEYATNLWYLRLNSSTNVSDLNPIQGLTSLKHIQISGNNNLNDISPLQNLTNLESFTLYSNSSLSDLSPLQNLNSMKRLSVSFMTSSTFDFSQISNFTNITSLSLVVNKHLRDISWLENMTQLESLNLTSNAIINIRPLGNLTNLEVLSLGVNYIRNIDALENLPNHRILNLRDNNISDLGALVRNIGFSGQDILWIPRNNLDLSTGSDARKDISSLRQRGVTVYLR